MKRVIVIERKRTIRDTYYYIDSGYHRRPTDTPMKKGNGPSSIFQDSIVSLVTISMIFLQNLHDKKSLKALKI